MSDLLSVFTTKLSSPEGPLAPLKLGESIEDSSGEPLPRYSAMFDWAESLGGELSFSCIGGGVSLKYNLNFSCSVDAVAKLTSLWGTPTDLNQGEDVHAWWFDNETRYRADLLVAGSQHGLTVSPYQTLQDVLVPHESSFPFQMQPLLARSIEELTRVYPNLVEHKDDGDFAIVLAPIFDEYFGLRVHLDTPDGVVEKYSFTAPAPSETLLRLLGQPTKEQTDEDGDTTYEWNYGEMHIKAICEEDLDCEFVVTHATSEASQALGAIPRT